MTLTVYDAAARTTAAAGYVASTFTLDATSLTVATGDIVVLAVSADELMTYWTNVTAAKQSGTATIGTITRDAFISGEGTPGGAAIFTMPVTGAGSLVVRLTYTPSAGYTNTTFSVKPYVVSGTGLAVGTSGTAKDAAPDGDWSPTLFTSTQVGRAFYAAGAGPNTAPTSITSSDTEDSAISGYPSYMAAYKAANHSASASVTGNVVDDSGGCNWGLAAVEIYENAGTSIVPRSMLLGVG